VKLAPEPESDFLASGGVEMALGSSVAATLVAISGLFLEVCRSGGLEYASTASPDGQR
jgi:hypothetical protein